MSISPPKQLIERVAPRSDVAGEIRLPFDIRQKSRVRAITTDGEVVGVHVERGTSLADGDHLQTAEGEVYVVRAEPEEVSFVSGSGALSLTRAAYHLGNRHVRLEVGQDYLAYQPDHVLDDMVRGLGFTVSRVYRPFEPEPGAYRHGAHSPVSAPSHHDHDHHHDHPHDHDHHHHHPHDHDHHHAVRSHIHGSPPEPSELG